MVTRWDGHFWIFAHCNIHLDLIRATTVKSCQSSRIYASEDIATGRMAIGVVAGCLTSEGFQYYIPAPMEHIFNITRECWEESVHLSVSFPFLTNK
jgi:hypothetical protein